MNNTKQTTIICIDCKEATPYSRNRKRCPECAKKKVQSSKNTWSEENKDYHRSYLKRWRRNLIEREKELEKNVR